MASKSKCFEADCGRASTMTMFGRLVSFGRRCCCCWSVPDPPNMDPFLLRWPGRQRCNVSSVVLVWTASTLSRSRAHLADWSMEQDLGKAIAAFSGFLDRRNFTCLWDVSDLRHKLSCKSSDYFFGAKTGK